MFPEFRVLFPVRSQFKCTKQTMFPVFHDRPPSQELRRKSYTEMFEPTGNTKNSGNKPIIKRLRRSLSRWTTGNWEQPSCSCIDASTRFVGRFRTTLKRGAAEDTTTPP